MTTFKNLCLPLYAALALGLGALGETVHAQSPVGYVNNLPAPDGNAYGTSLRYDSSGNLYAWDGLNVWKQSGSTGSFTNSGPATLGTSGTNSADAGPITLSQDGQSLLLSNGAGGQQGGAYNGAFFTMPVSGGTAAQVAGNGVQYTYDALALPGSNGKYIVNAGNSDYSSSTLSVFDASSGANVPVVVNGPGATTSIAINPTQGRVYVGAVVSNAASLTGFSDNIYSFSLSQIASNYSNATTFDFASGTLFNSTAAGSQTGAGLFFDSNGYLFSGGDGITVFNPSGSIVYDQPASALDNYYETLSYDPANNHVLVVPGGSTTGTLYNATDFESVPEPSTLALLGGGALAALVARRRRRTR